MRRSGIQLSWVVTCLVLGDARAATISGERCEQVAATPEGRSFGRVIEGRRYWYEASGWVGINVGCDGPCTKADPDGSTMSRGERAAATVADKSFACAGLRALSLVGKIGGQHCIQLGSFGSFVAPATGELVVLCNDCIYGDNSGFWEVALVAADAAGGSTHTALFQNGDRLTGRWLGLSATGIVQWQHVAAAQPLDFAAGSLRQVRMWPAAEFLAPAERALVEFRNGDRLYATVEAIRDRQLRLKSLLVEPVALPCPVVRWILVDSDTMVRERQGAAQQDRLTLRNGDELSGTIEGLAEGRLTLATEFARLEVPWARVQQIDWAQPSQGAASTKAATGQVILADGSRLSITLEAVAENQLWGRHAALGRIGVPLGAVRSVEFPSAPVQEMP